MTEHCCSCKEHHKEGTCSCGCGCGCGCGVKHHSRDMEGSCNCAEKFLEVADQAWIEVLKEKIKDKILQKKGEHIDKLAEIIATTNGEKWKHRIEARMACDKYKDTLKEFFTSGCE